MDGRQHDRLQRGRVGRALARLQLGGHQPCVDVVAEGQQRLPGVGGQGALDGEVVGVVDGRLGPQRAAVLEVLLDLGVLVVGLDHRRDAARDYLGLEDTGGRARDLSPEDDLHAVGTPEVQLVGDRALKPRAAGGRAIEDAGVRQLQLADRQAIAVACALGGGKR